MLPAALQHSHRIYDYTTEVLTEIGGTIWFRGPSFSGSDMLITSDPSNVHHVLSKNFSNYPKSDDFREIFEVFGDGIINAEPRLWELERKAILSFFTNKNFHHLMEKTTWNKIETGFSRWLGIEKEKKLMEESNILDELKTQFNISDEKNWRIFTAEESRGLVYLHGAICETLRLFPALSWQLQTSAKPDVLPSGHHIGANTKVLLSYYAMGRMEALWGKDCLEFRPERWISKRGEIESVPSYKFPAFNAGPRSCLGKEMPFIQMKMVAASILFKYKVRVVEDHPISPDRSIIIQMTHGLKVRLSRRDF
ncbi:hypothetical protein Leryth_025112 [Lithospermum erythrorhizon]|nr:hypothetical protein Leryth_025112 [Lithospermum erythrorhizon]